MCIQKSQMEKEVEEQKRKLLRSEQSLQASQTKEQDLRKKMEVWLLCIQDGGYSIFLDLMLRFLL